MSTDRGPAELVAGLEKLMTSIDDPDDLGGAAEIIEGLTTLRLLRETLASWEPRLIGVARRRGASWAEIAPALGVASRQAAERRYLRLNPNQNAGLTGEERVQAARDQRAGDRAVAGWARDNSARLRRLAGQITALDGLDAHTQQSVDRLHDALGTDDSAALLEPLAQAGPQLRDSHPALAGQVAEISEDAAQRRAVTRPGPTPETKDRGITSP
ncbi:MAG TPA: hypothetical protein VFT31_14420 [Kribbella sp.]|nr:hypothetical protein [Kribbella sp.]